MSSSVNSPYTSRPFLAWLALAIIFVIHFFGAIGLNTKYYTFFENLSGLNLLLSFLLVVIFHRPVNKRFFAFCSIVFIIGMLVEIAGVSTGIPFGLYRYTKLLGWQICGVPVIIGLNWVLLGYVSGHIVKHHIKTGWLLVISAALIMMSVDLLLEPFAIKHNFWVWQNGRPPLNNYLSWFVIALVIQVLHRILIPDTENKVASYYLLILLLFLVIDKMLPMYV